MTTPIPEPAQWLAQLFRSESTFPAQWQELSKNLAALQQDYLRQPARGKYRAIEAAPGRYVKEKAQ